MKFHKFEWMGQNFFYNPNKLLIGEAELNNLETETDRKEFDKKFIIAMDDLIAGKNIKKGGRYLGLEEFETPGEFNDLIYIGEIEVPEERVPQTIALWEFYTFFNSEEKEMKRYFNLAVKSLDSLDEEESSLFKKNYDCGLSEEIARLKKIGRHSSLVEELKELNKEKPILV